jgi:tetratricopeptide (TPR) repeat protein
MNKMLKAGLLLVGGALIASSAAVAQCKEWKWPQDKAKAEEQKVIYEDALKNKNYRGSVAAWQWLLNAAPNLNVKLYIDGVDIYDNLANVEKDPARKKVLVDSLLMLHDKRIETCGEEASVTNRKAFYAAKYNLNNKAEIPGLLALYTKTFELNKDKVMDQHLETYMKIVQEAKKQNLISDEEVLKRYDLIVSINDAKMKKAASESKPTDKYVKIKSNLDDALVKTVKVDCEFVKKNLEPKWKANPTDEALARKIFGFMLAGKCMEDPLAVETAEFIHTKEHDFGIAKYLGLSYLSKKNYDKGEAYLTEAVSLAPSQEDKADMYIRLGEIRVEKGDKTGARDMFEKALQANAKATEAYSKIGMLYYNSFDDCATREHMAKDRLVYLAAYDMFVKANDSRMMAEARKQFPSTSEIFELNWAEGSTQRVNCWIGKSVTIRTRGKE